MSYEIDLQKLLEIIKEQSDFPVLPALEDTFSSLGLDSLDAVEISMAIEEVMDITDTSPFDVYEFPYASHSTVQDLIDYMNRHGMHVVPAVTVTQLGAKKKRQSIMHGQPGKSISDDLFRWVQVNKATIEPIVSKDGTLWQISTFNPSHSVRHTYISRPNVDIVEALVIASKLDIKQY